MDGGDVPLASPGRLVRPSGIHARVSAVVHDLIGARVPVRIVLVVLDDSPRNETGVIDKHLGGRAAKEQVAQVRRPERGSPHGADHETVERPPGHLARPCLRRIEEFVVGRPARQVQGQFLAQQPIVEHRNLHFNVRFRYVASPNRAPVREEVVKQAVFRDVVRLGDDLVLAVLGAQANQDLASRDLLEQPAREVDGYHVLIDFRFHVTGIEDIVALSRGAEVGVNPVAASGIESRRARDERNAPFGDVRRQGQLPDGEREGKLFPVLVRLAGLAGRVVPAERVAHPVFADARPSGIANRCGVDHRHVHFPGAQPRNPVQKRQVDPCAANDTPLRHLRLGDSPVALDRPDRLVLDRVARLPVGERVEHVGIAVRIAKEVRPELAVRQAAAPVIEHPLLNQRVGPVNIDELRHAVHSPFPFGVAHVVGIFRGNPGPEDLVARPHVGGRVPRAVLEFKVRRDVQRPAEMELAVTHDVAPLKFRIDGPVRNPAVDGQVVEADVVVAVAVAIHVHVVAQVALGPRLLNRVREPHHRKAGDADIGVAWSGKQVGQSSYRVNEVPHILEIHGVAPRDGARAPFHAEVGFPSRNFPGSNEAVLIPLPRDLAFGAERAILQENGRVVRPRRANAHKAVVKIAAPRHGDGSRRLSGVLVDVDIAVKLHAVKVVPKDDVGHAGNRVRAVNGRGAVQKNLKAIDQAARHDHVQVGVGWRAFHARRRQTPPVDQDQRPIRMQAPKVERRGTRPVFQSVSLQAKAQVPGTHAQVNLLAARRGRFLKNVRRLNASGFPRNLGVNHLQGRDARERVPGNP